MDKISLPAKHLNMLIKAVASQTLSPEPVASVTYEDLSTSLFQPAGITDNTDTRTFVSNLQKYIAAAAHECFSDTDYTTFVEGSPFSEPVREALCSWWHDNRDEVLIQLATKQRISDSSSNITGISWKIVTETASSRTEGGEGGAEPRVCLELAFGDGSVSRSEMSKATLADILQQFGRIRKDIEKAAATS